MKRPNIKTPITKIISSILCVVIISLSWNIYSCYKDLYFIEIASKNSIILPALSKTPIINIINLLFSFIILATLQNIIYNIESNKEGTK